MFPHTAYSSFSRVRSMLWWSWSWYNLLTIGGTIVTLYIINLTASMLITTCFLQTKWCFIFRCFQIFVLIHIPSGFSMFVIYSSHIISYILWCNIILLVASLGNQIDACYSARTIFYMFPCSTCLCRVGFISMLHVYNAFPVHRWWWWSWVTLPHKIDSNHCIFTMFKYACYYIDFNMFHTKKIDASGFHHSILMFINFHNFWMFAST
jgi:hypothetical protein